MGDRRSRRLRNWRLRTKLAAVLVVPLLVIGALGTLRVVASNDDARALDALVSQVSAGQQVARLVDALQGERLFAETYVAGGRGAGRDQLDAQVQQVDAAAAAVRALPSTQFGPAAADLDAAARDRLADLAALRRAVTGSAFPTERVGSAYTAVIEVFLALEGAAFTAAPAPLLRAANDAMTVAAAKEQVRRQHATVAAVLIGGPTTALLEAARSAALADLGTAASPSLRERWAATVAGAEVDARQRIEQRVLTAMTRGEPLPTAQAGEWDRAAGRTAALIRDVEVAGQQQLATDGAALAASARAGAVRDGVLVALLVLLTVAVVVVVARSLLVPLRTLRGSAFQIARSRLPATIAGMTARRRPDPRRARQADRGGHPRGDRRGRARLRRRPRRGRAARRGAGPAAAQRERHLRHLARRGQNLVGRQLAVLDRLEQRRTRPRPPRRALRAGAPRDPDAAQHREPAGAGGRGAAAGRAGHRRAGAGRRGRGGDRAARDGRGGPAARRRGARRRRRRPRPPARRAAGERHHVRAARLQGTARRPDPAGRHPDRGDRRRGLRDAVAPSWRRSTRSWPSRRCSTRR